MGIDTGKKIPIAFVIIFFNHKGQRQSTGVVLSVINCHILTKFGTQKGHV